MAADLVIEAQTCGGAERHKTQALGCKANTTCILAVIVIITKELWVFSKETFEKNAKTKT